MDLGGASATGGESRYSDTANQLTLATSVTAVNDRPVVTGSGPVAIAVTEDSVPAGATALSFVAVVGNAAVAGQGSWQYLANGSSWTDVPATGLSAASALVLDTATQVRFVPTGDFHGTPGALTLRLADGSANPVTASGSASDLKDLSVNGGTGLTGRWSAASIGLQPTGANVNDAPTASGTATLPAIAEDTPAASIPGATVASLFGPLYGDAAVAPAIGSVLANDVEIDAGDPGTVTTVGFGVTTGAVGTALAGGYGSLTLKTDGTWSYAIDNASPAVQALAAGETLTETFAYTVTDTADASSSSTLTITGTNDAPTVTGAPPAVLGNAEQEMALTVDRSRFADVDLGDSLTFTATLADGRPLPSWLSFDPATLSFRGTPPARSR